MTKLATQDGNPPDPETSRYVGKEPIDERHMSPNLLSIVDWVLNMRRRVNIWGTIG